MSLTAFHNLCVGSFRAQYVNTNELSRTLQHEYGSHFLWLQVTAMQYLSISKKPTQIGFLTQHVTSSATVESVPGFSTSWELSERQSPACNLCLFLHLQIQPLPIYTHLILSLPPTNVYIPCCGYCYLRLFLNQVESISFIPSFLCHSFLCQCFNSPRTGFSNSLCAPALAVLLILQIQSGLAQAAPPFGNMQPTAYIQIFLCHT